MRKINFGGVEYSATFTTWAANEFFKLSGINVYEPGELVKVFKPSEADGKLLPSHFELAAKFAYCAMAAAVMPKDAEDDWRPPFTWRWAMNLFNINDDKIFAQLVAVYYDQDLKVIQEEGAKNPTAPQETGQTVEA